MAAPRGPGRLIDPATACVYQRGRHRWLAAGAPVGPLAPRAGACPTSPAACAGEGVDVGPTASPPRQPERRTADTPPNIRKLSANSF